MKTTVLSTILLSLMSVAALAQNTPTVLKDIAYDDKDPAQKLDVYLSKSDKPVPAMIHIHGGGWRGGSKNGVPGWLMKAVSDGWLTVISVEYRFTNVAPHPAQTNDCLRAIQFVRLNAEKWKIDPNHMGVTGGSAGGHLSLYVALHDDVADAKSSDPVQQQSSRVACAVSFAGPTDWNLLGEMEHKHPAYRQLIGYEPGTPVKDMDVDAMKDVSPITFVSSDDPPIMQVHGDADDIVPVEHARRMDKRLKSIKGKSELVIVPGANHGVAGAGDNVSKEAEKFVRELLVK